MTIPPQIGAELEIDLELIRRFDGRGPRYTSYPTADRFVEAFDAAAYESWLARRNIGGVLRPLSLYLHLPFCSTLCFYCGCNKVVTRDRTKGEAYLRYVNEEIALQSATLTGDKQLRQMHWGGGTPNFFSIEQVTGLWQALREHFDFDVAGEYSIADIAIWPWISRYEWQTIDMKQYPNVLRWYTTIANDRPDHLRNILALPDILVGFSDAGAHFRGVPFA